jgi:hypothetical protein
MSSRLEFAQKLKEAGANAEQIQSAFNLYRDKNGAFDDEKEKEKPQEKPMSMMDALLPGTLQNSDEGLSGAMKWGPQEAFDLLNAPTRGLATLRGQRMDDPNAYLFRPETEEAIAKAESDLKAHPELLNRPDPVMGGMMGVGMMPSAGMVPGLVEQGGRIASDPLTIFGMIKDALGMGAAPVLRGAGEQIYSGAAKIPKALKKSEGISPVDILESGYGGSIRPNYEQTITDLRDLSAQKRKLLEEHGRQATVTSQSPDITLTPPPGKTGLDAQYEVHQTPPDVIYGQAPAGASPGTPQITDGRIPMGAPKGARPPDMAVTPPGEMPNQIDPRYVKPTATPTSNQPPIPGALGGEAYGIPSDRNLPALFQKAGPLVVQQSPEMEAVQNALALRSSGEMIPVSSPTIAEAGPEVIPGRKSIKDVTRVVDIRGQLQAIKNRLAQEILDYGHSGKTEDIANGVREWEAELNNAKAGPASLLEAHDFAQGVGEMGYWKKGQNPKEIPAKAHVAEEFYDALRNAIVDKAPETADLNQKMTNIIPINKALKETLMRTENNHPISLTDVTMGAGLPALLASGHLKEAGALAGGLAIKKAAQSPMIGNALYQAGKKIDNPTGTAIKAAILKNALGYPQEEGQ